MLQQKHNPSQKKLKRNYKKDLKIELLTLKLLSNLLNKDCLHVLAQDPANAAEQMDIFYKEENSSSTQKKSIKERNDLVSIYFHHSIEYFEIT